MTDAAHIFQWITERLRTEIIDNDRSPEEAVQMVLDATNREDRQLMAEFHISNKADVFVRMRQVVAKMLEADT